MKNLTKSNYKRTVVKSLTKEMSKINIKNWSNSALKISAYFVLIFSIFFFINSPMIASAEGRWKGDGNGGCYWDPVDTGPDQCDPNNTGGTGGNPSGWRQDIQYSINDSGSPVVYYYNVKQNGNKIFNWNVTVNFNGPDTMHVRTIGAYDDTAGSSPTVAHHFGVPPSGKVDYRSVPDSGSFSFSYDTRYRTCGRVQIDGSFIDELDGNDSQLFFAIVVDYGDDCVPEVVNHPPVLTLVGSSPVTVFQNSSYVDQGATAQDQEDGNITDNIVKTGSVNTSVLGTYTLTYNVSDSKGLSAIPVTRIVNVIQAPINHVPVLTLVGANPITVYQGANYVDAGATAQDQEDGNITNKIVVSGLVSTSTIGSYTLTYNVSDSQGLPATPITRTVNVVAVPQNNPPVLTLLGANPEIIYVGTNYVDSGATASDIEDGNITGRIASTTNVNTSVVGSYYVTYNVSDSQGLSATPVTRNVNVIEKPISTVVVTKIVCNNEFDLPNWGDGSGPDIGVNTAKSFLSNHPNCKAEPQWKFQWALNEVNPGNNILTEAPAPWKTFGPTDSFGNATTTIPATLKPDSNHPDKVWFREVQKEGFITFVGVDSKSTVSAEIYCNEDHRNYDNYDYVLDPVADKTYYCIAFNAYKVLPQNLPPIITLIGANPIDIYVGDMFVDPGATAQDPEEGNITSRIVVSGTVDTSTVGSYTLTYNVADSQGLSAVPVSRTINVLYRDTPKGKITFCTILADNQNAIATSSYGLPSGVITLNLATSTNISSTTIQSANLNIGSFSPDRKIILNQNDADCVTYSNLEYGNYFYSQAVVTGTLLNIPKYNDGYNQPINNVFDFYAYSPELFNTNPADDSSRNLNSDGMVVLDSLHNDLTVVLYDTYNPAPQCVLPQINSLLTASVTVNNTFTYTLTASSSTDILNVATTTLPTGLSFATSTGIISGTPTQTGTFNITMTASNQCGVDTQVLVLTVLPVITSPSANLNITKTADKSTANVGDTITYTVLVTNNGSSTATNVNVLEAFPSQLTFVSYSVTSGSYSTSTNIWDIGTLSNGSTTTMTLVGTVNAGTAGQNISNTVSVSASENDPDNSNNTSTVGTTINNPGCTSNCGGGGGAIAETNLQVTKVVDRSTANVGDNLVYTITAKNNGPYGATNVKVTESFPAFLNFVSATTTSGTYDQSTGIWSIGDLPNASTTVLTIVGTINNNASGQTVTNTTVITGSQSDPDSTNNTSSVSTTVNSTGCTSNCGGGGGGGGNGPIVGSYGGGNGPIVSQPAPTPAPTTCYYLYDYLRKDFINNPVEVKKLQVFLRDLEGFSNLQITGVYDDQTISALNAFQNRYKDDILTPWGHTAPTGYTYILTKKKVNEIYCKMAFPVTSQQQQEIDNFRNFLNSLKNAGVVVPSQIENLNNGTSTNIDNIVGTIIDNTGNTQENEENVILVGTSTERRSFGDFTASVFLAGRDFANRIYDFISWPFRYFGEKAEQCTRGIKLLGWLNILYTLIIFVLIYLWYREYKNNRVIEDINKEIDLNK